MGFLIIFFFPFGFVGSLFSVCNLEVVQKAAQVLWGAVIHLVISQCSPGSAQVQEQNDVLTVK